MPKNGWPCLLLLLLLLCVGGSAKGATSVRYTLDRPWTTYDGLPDDAVIGMKQTRDGYLWLGTPHGLARFDGVRFSVYKEGDVPGLNSSRIVKIFEDSRTNLWLATDGAGLFRVQNNGKVEQIDTVNGVQVGRVMSICEDTRGAVWLYTGSGQLVRYQDGQMELGRVQLDNPSECRAAIADEDGLLWVGTDHWLRGIPVGAEWMATNSLPLAFSMTYFQKLEWLLASKRGGYWRLADGQVQKCRGDRVQPGCDWPYPWKNSRVNAACEDREGNLIVGTLGEGVFWFDASGRFAQLRKGQGLSGDYILSLCVDREGSLWVGTDGDGLDRVKPEVFDVLAGTDGALVQSVCADQQGGVWFGINHGVNNGAVGYWKDGVMRQLTNAQEVVYSTVRSALVDRDGRVWVGTSGGLYPLEGGRFATNMLTLPVSALHQDRRGLLWVGTPVGLWCWDQHQWKAFTTKEGLSANSVQAILDDAEGNLWVGTEGGGLNRLRDGKVTWFSRTNGLPSNNVFSLYLDGEGVLWVGTSIGLARFDGANWCRYSKREGLVSDNISYLVEDGQGYLWMGTDAGLMRVRKELLNDFARGKLKTVAVRAFGNPDGLPTGRCTFGSQPGAARTSDGTLWFPTIKGLVFVNPEQLAPNTNPPPVVIESVWIDNELQTANSLRSPSPREVFVPAGKEALDIGFTSLNLSASDKTSFRYRLEKHETAWQLAESSNRKAHYTRLPPNRYIFRVQACNEDGVWSTTEATLSVTVLPPFWRTWWFIAIAGSCFLLAVVGLVHYVSTQRLQRQLEGLRQKEALEKERARIARDIHDQVGANLTQVSLLGELVESDKDHPEEVEAHARQISQTALETTRALDEIVWTVNPSNDTLDGLINYICKYAQEYLAVAGLRYRLETPEQLPSTPITPELRHNVFLAAKEAVNNVVKHSQATAAFLRLQIEPHQFVLEVEDNGRGVPAGAEKKGRNGLRNMRKRMEDIGGQFEMAPGAEGGTRVRLVAPLK